MNERMMVEACVRAARDEHVSKSSKNVVCYVYVYACRGLHHEVLE